MGDKVGSQDQTAAACGGFNVIRFHQSGEIELEPLAISEERRREIASRLLLVYTGSSRLSSKLAGVRDFEPIHRASVLAKLQAMADVGRDILESGDLHDFGRLLNESWVLKQQLSAGVSTPEIDSALRDRRSSTARSEASCSARAEPVSWCSTCPRIGARA